MGFLNWLGSLFLEVVLKKVFAFFGSVLAMVKRNKEIDDESKASVQPLKDAKTQKEIDDAARDALGGF